jgi:hypothetical protein
VPDPEQRWRADVLEGQPAVREVIAALPDAARRALHDRYVAALESYRREEEIRLPCEAIFVAAVR